MSLQVKDRIAANGGKSRILGGPEGIRENLFIERYSSRDGSRNDQGLLVTGKVSYVSGGWVRDCAATVWLGIYRQTQQVIPAPVAALQYG